MSFEDKKFCQIRKVVVRWDCSFEHIYDLLSRPGTPLKAWHPEGKISKKGLLLDVASILECEKRGYHIISPS